MFENFRIKLVYRFTEKPEQYIHVDKPITLQDKRQIQYNKWCQRIGVYNGSYLPTEPKTLLHKGWTNKKPNGKEVRSERYLRKSNGQDVMFHERVINKNGQMEDKHYHWFSKHPTKKVEGEEQKNYIDRYGKICSRGSRESHLAPKDNDYHWRDK